MNRHIYTGNFEQWLLEKHNRLKESLSWDEYSKYSIQYNNETFFERMIDPYVESEEA